MYFPFHQSRLGFALEKFFWEKGDGGKSEGSESEQENSRSNMTPLVGKTTLQCILVILQAYVELVSREKGWEERGRIRAGKFPIQCDTSVEKGCQHRKCSPERKCYSTEIEMGESKEKIERKGEREKGQNCLELFFFDTFNRQQVWLFASWHIVSLFQSILTSSASGGHKVCLIRPSPRDDGDENGA